MSKKKKQAHPIGNAPSTSSNSKSKSAKTAHESSRRPGWKHQGHDAHQLSPMDHNSAGQQQADQEEPAASMNQRPSPPPQHSPQNISYHQQQQLHQQHLQRIGGLQRLTADLAGLQFDDPDALLRNLPQLSKARQIQSKHLKYHVPPQAHPQTPSPPSPPPPPSQRPTHTMTATRIVIHKHEQGSPDQLQQLQPLTRLERDEVDLPQVQSATESQNSEPTNEQARDAQETAEDMMMVKRYRILHLIGLGNYARVYKATFPQNNKELAIKAINLTKTTDHYRQKFLPRELSILKRISHVNICKIYEILQVSDRIFIVMQFCSRGTIADLLQRNNGPFSEPVARFLFVPAVDAIVYLHSMDIAHRDIKIENILLDQEFVPKLTDFSYGCLINESAKSSSARSPKQGAGRAQLAGHPSLKLNETFCGTLPYLSPEMIRQHAYDSKKTDSWSLGICLYVMLNDRLPFPFNDIKAMVRKQLAKDYKFRANLETSESCRDLMSQILEPNFFRRLGSQEISRHPWLMEGPRERPAVNK